MDRRIDIFSILKNEGKLENVYLYMAQEVEVDPFEKSKELVYDNSITIKGIVRHVSAEAITWKYYGNIKIGSIEVITEKKNLSLIRTADKIKYNDEYFVCYKDSSKGFAILERNDYIVVILNRVEFDE